MERREEKDLRPAGGVVVDDGGKIDSNTRAAVHKSQQQGSQASSLEHAGGRRAWSGVAHGSALVCNRIDLKELRSDHFSVEI